MQDLFLMPFSPNSTLLFHTLLNKNISILGFLDNNKAIDGMSYFGCPIVTPESVVKSNGSEEVIVCEPRHYEANEAQLALLGYNRLGRIDEWMTYDEAKCNLSNIDKEAFLRIAPYQAYSLKMLPWTIQKFTLPESAKADDALIIDILLEIITEICSLRCKKCANLMQYYINPKHMDLSQIYNDIDLIFSKTDWIREFYLSGGEVFLFQQLSEVMEYLSKYRNSYGILSIITNGTVVPDDRTLQSIKRHDMLINISDYGKSSRKIDELVSKLECYQIPHQRYFVKWYDYQQLRANRNAQNVFSKCKENCATLRDGLLYRCPFLAHAEALCAVPYSKNNSIDISCKRTKKTDIAEYLAPSVNRTTLPPPGCDYCSGYDVGNMQAIPTAEQVNMPLPYIRYKEQ
jgi:organic radical activating enzyme